MRLNLRSLVLAPVVLAAAALAITPAMAETHIKVPFDFSVAGKKCPAGVYVVEQGSWHNSVKLEGPAGTFGWTIGPGQPLPTDNRVILRFDQIHGMHMLKSVQYGPLITGNLDGKAKTNPPM